MSLLPSVGPLPYAHLLRMATARGVYEHARLDRPRAEHGYCADDVARALVVTVREPIRSSELEGLVEICLRFLEAAVAPDGRVRNRMSRAGRWTEAASIGDWWGRTVGALGFAAVHAPDPIQRGRAARAFARAAEHRSPDVRASAFAVIGAAEIVRADAHALTARRLLEDSMAVIPLAATPDWTWPEARMRYANATLCEALIVGGSTLERRPIVDRGLEFLAFLIATETGPAGRLSLTGSGGRAPGQRGPLWDQQPIEAAAIADACAGAYQATGDEDWLVGIELAWTWFLGANDSDTPMVDARTGAGFDGLEPGGRNRNRGAESTIAALSTCQRARETGLIEVS